MFFLPKRYFPDINYLNTDVEFQKMAYLSKQDLLQAEEEGKMKVTRRLDYSAFSLNLRVNRLFKPRSRDIMRVQAEAKSFEDPFESVDDDEYLNRFTDEINLTRSGVVLSGAYLWLPLEKITLAPGFFGDIASRSSYARLGTRVKNTGQLGFLKKRYQGKPLCTINTTGTEVKIRKNEPIGQLLVSDGNNVCLDSYLVKMIEEGILKINRSGNRLGVEDLVFYGGVVLTMAPEIWVYRQGEILEKKKLKEKCFEKMTLPASGERPWYLPKGSFWISGSAERIAIADGFIGYVQEGGHVADVGFTTHPNAPYIGPETVFEGSITFENYAWSDVMLNSGIYQSKLVVFSLITPCGRGEESRYKGQETATLSKI